MIAQEEIIELSNKYQTGRDNVLREYFQHLFLSYFYKQPLSTKVFFKGGTNLRIVHHSPRFSEDLDFNSSLTYEEIESLVVDVLENLEKEGVSFTLEEAKETSGGYLTNIFFSGLDQTVQVQLEISLREKDPSGEITAILNDYMPDYNLITVSDRTLVQGKIDALLSRGKPRDFYDFYYILRSQMPLPEDKELFTKVLNKLNNANLNFETELKQFLPKSHWLIIRDFKNSLTRELERHMGR